jgi:hypothetical protein
MSVSGYIYKIWSIGNDEVYIGSTKKPAIVRFREHVYSIWKRKRCQAKIILKRDYDGTRLDIIEKVTASDENKLEDILFAREMFYILRIENTINVQFPVKTNMCICGISIDKNKYKQHKLTENHKLYVKNMCDIEKCDESIKENDILEILKEMRVKRDNKLEVNKIKKEKLKAKKEKNKKTLG